ncbi:MAG TPA: phage/plasmid primase, P4 family [Ligilactobacillus saerimneri]|nr:phage/plasmid primase, P4 family [Ligilactobacillus saerimneri]
MSKFKEIKRELAQWGNDWRADHAKMNNKTSETKTIPVPARVIANRLKQSLKLVVIGEDDKELEKAPLSYYDPDAGIYVNGSRRIQELMLAIESTISKRWRKEILDWLQIESPAVKLTDDPDLIPVGNGIINLKDKRLIPFNSKYVFTTKIATNYNPDATEPNFNGWSFSDWIKQLSNSDHEKELLLWQFIASIVRGKTGLMFMLVDAGQGRTGKSTMEQFLINLVGNGNYKALMLDQFDNDFLLAQGYGGRLLIGDDNPPERYIDNGSNLKSIITNEIVLINPKGLPPFTARFNAIVIQSMNGLPKFKDKTGGLYRRFRMINFPHQFPDDPASKRVKDTYIYDKRLLEWVLKKSLDINLDQIVNPKESKELVENTRLDNDPVAYFASNYIDPLVSEYLPVKFLFHYFLWVMERENNKQTLSQRKFTTRIKPIMENMGWKFYVTGRRPGNKFKQADLDLMDKYDPGTGLNIQKLYNLEEEKDRMQGIFAKTS